MQTVWTQIILLHLEQYDLGDWVHTVCYTDFQKTTADDKVGTFIVNWANIYNLK